MTVGTYERNLGGQDLRIGIVQSRVNEDVCHGLLSACLAELKHLGGADEDVLQSTVPGALEIPLALQKMAETRQFDADNFELAVSAAEQSRDFDRMLKGVEMVFGELREVLEGEGLVKIEAEGKPFDPERHEAVIAVEQEDMEPGMVVDTVRTGYELRGKVLRPAMVKVAK